MALKVYLPKGRSARVARPYIRRAIRMMNRQLGGRALQLTSKPQQANIKMKFRPSTSKATAYASRIPTSSAQAYRGKTHITMPSFGGYSKLVSQAAQNRRRPNRYTRTVYSGLATHELSHALGVTHEMMEVPRSGGKFMLRTMGRMGQPAIKQARRVAGLTGPRRSRPYRGGKW